MKDRLDRLYWKTDGFDKMIRPDEEPVMSSLAIFPFFENLPELLKKIVSFTDHLDSKRIEIEYQHFKEYSPSSEIAFPESHSLQASWSRKDLPANTEAAVDGIVFNVTPLGDDKFEYQVFATSSRSDHRSDSQLPNILNDAAHRDPANFGQLLKEYNEISALLDTLEFQELLIEELISMFHLGNHAILVGRSINRR